MAVQLRATSDLMVGVYLTEYPDTETKTWRRKKYKHFIFVLERDISPRNIQKHVENPSYTRINFEEYNFNYIIILLDSISVYLRTIYGSGVNIEK